MAGSAEEVRKHVKVYLMVLLALAVLTVVTVGVSYLRLPTGAAILVALVIASVKGSLVACYFMHLISENKVIYSLLVLCFLFLAALLLLPVATSNHFWFR